MIAALKAEFRKLATVRSTYVILLICLGLEILFAFYATAFHAQVADAADPLSLTKEVTNAISFLSALGALIGLLLVTHEYRYNTIVYSLSAAKNRSQVFFAKVFAISCLAVIFALVFGALSPLLAELGWHVRGLSLAPQHFDFWNLLWRAVFSGWAYFMLGLVIAFLIRVQVGAIATLLLFPGTVEQLLGLILKKNQVYLPFSSIMQILDNKPANLSHGHAAIVALAYVVGGLLVAWMLFLRRDAN